MNLSEERYRNHYEDVFCRYALACDRIKPLPIKSEVSMKYNKGLNLIISAMKKDYALCSHLQLSLNFLRNNLAWSTVNNLIADRDLNGDFSKFQSLEEKSFSSQQLLLRCLLRCLFYYFSLNVSNQGGVKEVLSKDDFFMLFNNICTYGASSITEMATSVLFMLCGSSSWWCDALVDVFQHCFCMNKVVPLPRRR